MLSKLLSDLTSTQPYQARWRTYNSPVHQCNWARQ